MKHAFIALLLASSAAGAQTVPGTRGALLYETHCIACHDVQVHWRDKKVARDWPGLKGEVRRWQGNNTLGWGEEDIDAVADYLNWRFYRYTKPVTPA